MKNVRITVIRKSFYPDLSEKYENPISHACDLQEGKVFISEGGKCPVGLCESAWSSMAAFVMTLAHGGEDFYDGWMKNKKSAMISCNDGFRPVSCLLETLEMQESQKIQGKPGSAGKPEDAERPEDEGRPEDTGRPEDEGK